MKSSGARRRSVGNHTTSRFYCPPGDGARTVPTTFQTFYVKVGDIVCTKAGDEHDIIEVYEYLEAFYFEDATPAVGRVGHLHRIADKAKGHPVPSLPIPKDFPQ